MTGLRVTMIAVLSMALVGDAPSHAPLAAIGVHFGERPRLDAVHEEPQTPSGSPSEQCRTVAWEEGVRLSRLPPTEEASGGLIPRRLPAVAGQGGNAPSPTAGPQAPSQTRPTAARPQTTGRIAAVQPLPSPSRGNSPGGAAGNGPIDWWAPRVSRPFQAESPQQAVSVEMLVLEALRRAPQIQALSDRPVIQEMALLEAATAFDFVSFAESRFDRASDPVGNLLTTGGPNRFRQVNTTMSAGLRKKTPLGSRLEVKQDLGLKNNNSRFFVPTQQGNTRLTLSVEQPLLNGAGRAYNNGAIVLAQINSEVAWNDFVAELNQYLVDVASAYWELYRSRAAYLQKLRWNDQADQILAELESRREIDTLNTQLARARAAVASRRSALIRAGTEIRNAQTNIHALVYDVPLQNAPPREMIPVEAPGSQFVPIAAEDALVTAMQNRPEIDRAMKEIEASRVRLDLSRNELLPALDFVAETYVAGLRGNWRLGQSYLDQFSVGEPGYSVGLVYEFPLGNRAAKARFTRRQLEQRQLVKQFQGTVQMLQAEVVVAVREVETSYRELQGRTASMRAAMVDVQYLTERWRLLPGDDRSASYLLADLLDAQDRLALEQGAYLEAQVAYSVALLEFKRRTGTLLRSEQIEIHHGERDGLPSLLLNKPPGPPLSKP